MTDRRLRSAADLDSLRFDDQGLVPVVALGRRRRPRAHGGLG